jgi:hypothetical protein
MRLPRSKNPMFRTRSSVSFSLPEVASRAYRRLERAACPHRSSAIVTASRRSFQAGASNAEGNRWERIAVFAAACTLRPYLSLLPDLGIAQAQMARSPQTRDGSEQADRLTASGFPAAPLASPPVTAVHRESRCAALHRSRYPGSRNRVARCCRRIEPPPRSLG